MFRRRLLMQQAMSVPDPIAKYDPTGHTNEDMAEYPVLTDLTGNGHDITLNNFAWTEESGISTVNHPNALVSDGVDDYGICENFPILTKEKGYTVVAVRKLLQNKPKSILVSNSLNWNAGSNLGAFVVEYISATGIKYARSFGGSNVVEFPSDDFIYQSSNKYNETKISIGLALGQKYLRLFHDSTFYGSYALYSLEIYDRDLTPYQIEAVKKRLMDKYNNPEDTTSDWYGVEWYTNQSPSRVMRIGNVNLHKSLPIQSGMYRCILNDNGEEVYKLDPNDSTKKEDGTPAVLDGTDGQVMVYIPVFYARFESKGYRRRVKLSDHYKPGFIKMGGCYISAYEATVDRTVSGTPKLASVVNTTANFRGGNNNAEWDSTYRSFLGMPATSISLTNFRNYARNRKDGDTQWNCMDYTAYKAIYWLYVVEYADRNCQLDFNENLTSDGFRQGGLGAGVTNIDSIKWNSFNSYYPFVPCGHTNSLGNKTGIVQFIMPFEYDAGGASNYAGAYDSGTPYTDGQFVSDGQELYECIADAAAGTDLSDTTYFTNVPRTSTHVPSYRGIENIFGHIRKWTDGVHIKVQSEESGGKSILYTSDNPANYQDTDYEGYEEKGYVARANGYVRDIIFGRDGDFYVSEDGATGGSITTYFSDYSYTNIPESGESLRGLLLSGIAISVSYAGLVCVYSNYGPSVMSTNFGSLLCYIPNNNNN